MINSIQSHQFAWQWDLCNKWKLQVRSESRTFVPPLPESWLANLSRIDICGGDFVLYSKYTMIYIFCIYPFRGHAVAQWLRHCATNRKVAGSIPDSVIWICHWHNPSGRTMALESTQPLTELSTRNNSWGQRRPVRRADNLTTFMCRLS
jgi:hypothetical protein